MPVIKNPVLPGEHFNRHWDQAKYENFRDKIHRYRQWTDDAYAEPDQDESIAKWRRVFGDGFAQGKTVKAESCTLAPLFTFADRWLTALREQGRAILRTFPVNQEHVAAPMWPMENRLPVTIRAGQTTFRNGEIEREPDSGTFVPTNRWLRFTAHCPTGIPAQFKVWWRVVNTGGHAARLGQLRGGFWPSKPANIRWEKTQFRGVHWVEAFIVNSRTNSCVGKSDPFFVVID